MSKVCSLHIFTLIPKSIFSKVEYFIIVFLFSAYKGDQQQFCENLLRFGLFYCFAVFQIDPEHKSSGKISQGHLTVQGSYYGAGLGTNTGRTWGQRRRRRRPRRRRGGGNGHWHLPVSHNHSWNQKSSSHQRVQFSNVNILALK